MYPNNFDCLCKRAKNEMHSVFNGKHATVRLNQIYQFRGNPRILTKIECGHNDRHNN